MWSTFISFGLYVQLLFILKKLSQGLKTIFIILLLSISVINYCSKGTLRKVQDLNFLFLRNKCMVNRALSVICFSSLL